MVLHTKIGDLEGKSLDRVLSRSSLPEVGIELARQVKEIRFAHRLSQDDLAKKMKVKQSVVSRIECGRSGLTVKSLDKFCKALDYEVVLRKREENLPYRKN